MGLLRASDLAALLNKGFTAAAVRVKLFAKDDELGKAREIRAVSLYLYDRPTGDRVLMMPV